MIYLVIILISLNFIISSLVQSNETRLMCRYDSLDSAIFKIGKWIFIISLIIVFLGGVL
ncbi:MAG: hypothetical protein ACRC7S_05690 [Cetobacterium sp.]